MAVFRNYYNRRILSWTVTVSCLYLLCSTAIVTISCSLTNGERLRHQHVKPSHLEKDSIVEDNSKTTVLSCPNCLFKHNRDRDSLESDELRLDAIKQQILQKLGLKAKPNVTHSLPKELVMATLSRTQKEEFSRMYEEYHYWGDSSNLETVDVDDFYGKTSEIISFAEQGSWVNQNRLLEFLIADEGSQPGQDFRVKQASLWLKSDFIKRSSSKCRITDIFVFQVISNRLPESVTLSSKQFERLAGDPVAIVSLNASSSGWQKIDVTQMVSTWLSEPLLLKDKLKLFVDCSCCGNWRIHLFNHKDNEKVINRNRPFLVIHTDPNSAKRVKRRAIDCSGDSGNQCCKQRFYVNFKALGWEDWVIAPQGYYANYCRGDCGHHRTPDTFVSYHTHVIEEVRKTQHLSGMTPCCAPLKFSSMSLIYYGPESTIIKRDLPKMVVDECGCP
ncbi:inhibin beta chain [Euwallacea fornicatus]|uniref:inhibin beta chain n=1 Tax=Euwallacea fornicatus TaxID=995702 RepID=UPI00338EDFBE